MTTSPIKKARIVAGLTQIQVAKAMGVSQPTYQRWESRAVNVPTKQLDKLAKVLDCTLSLLIGKPEPFDLLGIDKNISDKYTYFGEVAFHFHSGSRPLLLPISDAVYTYLNSALSNADAFIEITSLDNRTVFIRNNAISDIFFSSDAYDDYGPDDYGDQHLGIFPYDAFWKILEHSECIECLEDEFSPQEIKDVLSNISPAVSYTHLNLNNPTIPDLPYSDWVQLFEIGVALVFILYAESYGSIRSFAIKHHDTIYPNRDLFALGISNIVSGLFQGMPVGAGYSATAANEAYGARTRIAGIAAMIITFLIILTVLPYIEWIPQPVLAAIVIFTMATTLSLSSFRLYFTWKIDRALIVLSVLAVLVLGVLQGLMIAIAISLLIMLRQNSKSTVSVLGRLGQSHDFVSLTAFPEAQPVSGILIVRPDQAMFFANSDRILVQVRDIISSSKLPIHTVILSLEQTPDLDATTVEALRDFFENMKKESKKLILARLKPPVHDVLLSALSEEHPEVSLSRLSVERAVRLARIKENPNRAAETALQ